GNYRGESDNLFLRGDNGFYRDLSTAWKLPELTDPLVAFGSKALDFDRNGWLDLAVTNGHIFDMTWMNQGYKMPPHLLMSQGNAFAKVNASQMSEYWSGNYLGRAMAVLDFDRNLQPDLIIGHLDQPAALLANQTQSNAAHVMLELIGVTSERDAIGTRVDVFDGRQSAFQVTTGGDGYLCCDENFIELCLPTEAESLTVTIRWSSGSVQKHLTVEPGKRYLAVEGQTTLTPR
ncbi:MAG: ASPIC/UnbV domain-containing protein, partial [Planctomycetota bacterium]